MFLRVRSLVLFIATVLLVWSVGFTTADAQQNPPNPVTKSAPSPTPPVKDEDEVIKVDTDVVNVLFTAQDHNRRLLNEDRDHPSAGSCDVANVQ